MKRFSDFILFLEAKEKPYDILKQLNKNNLYISFTEIPKLGINPRTSYDTPIGMYSYPAWASHEYIENFSFPFATDKPYIQLFRAKNPDNVAYGSSYTSKNLYFDLMKLQNIFNIENINNILESIDEDYKNTPIQTIWSLTRELAQEVPSKWTTYLKALYDGFVDDEGHGFIHPSEPIQAVFFEIKKINHIDTIFKNRGTSIDLWKQDKNKTNKINFLNYMRKMIKDRNIFNDFIVSFYFKNVEPHKSYSDKEIQDLNNAIFTALSDNNSDISKEANNFIKKLNSVVLNHPFLLRIIQDLYKKFLSSNNVILYSLYNTIIETMIQNTYLSASSINHEIKQYTKEFLESNIDYSYKLKSLEFIKETFSYSPSIVKSISKIFEGFIHKTLNHEITVLFQDVSDLDNAIDIFLKKFNNIGGIDLFLEMLKILDSERFDKKPVDEVKEKILHELNKDLSNSRKELNKNQVKTLINITDNFDGNKNIISKIITFTTNYFEDVEKIFPTLESFKGFINKNRKSLKEITIDDIEQMHSRTPTSLLNTWEHFIRNVYHINDISQIIPIDDDTILNKLLAYSQFSSLCRERNLEKVLENSNTRNIFLEDIQNVIKRIKRQIKSPDLKHLYTDLLHPLVSSLEKTTLYTDDIKSADKFYDNLKSLFYNKHSKYIIDFFIHVFNKLFVDELFTIMSEKAPLNFFTDKLLNLMKKILEDNGFSNYHTFIDNVLIAVLYKIDYSHLSVFQRYLLSDVLDETYIEDIMEIMNNPTKYTALFRIIKDTPAVLRWLNSQIIIVLKNDRIKDHTLIEKLFKVFDSQSVSLTKSKEAYENYKKGIITNESFKYFFYTLNKNNQQLS